jgi:hypothetical protein
MNKASISSHEIKVEHSIRPDVGREFLTLDVEGWDDVRKLTKKVLVFGGKKFTFSGWNSDTNQCFFAKPLHGEAHFAQISSK